METQGWFTIHDDGHVTVSRDAPPNTPIPVPANVMQHLNESVGAEDDIFAESD